MEAEHHDPVVEGVQRGLDRLMAVGVLTEAGARLAAEHARAKASQVEHEPRDRAPEDPAQRDADRLAAVAAAERRSQWESFVADRERLADHLAGLPLHEIAAHWGQAAPHASHNRTAATVLRATETELRRRWPALMQQYDQLHANGLPRAEAMRRAATYARFGGGPARRHGGRPPTSGALTVIGEELAGEVAQLAGRLDPVARARLLGNLEDDGWSPSARAYVEGQLDAADGRPDDPAHGQDVANGACQPPNRTASDKAAGDSPPAVLAQKSFAVAPEHLLADAAAARAAPGPVPTPAPHRRRRR